MPKPDARHRTIEVQMGRSEITRARRSSFNESNYIHEVCLKAYLEPLLVSALGSRVKTGSISLPSADMVSTRLSSRDTPRVAGFLGSESFEVIDSREKKFSDERCQSLLKHFKLCMPIRMNRVLGRLCKF